jgi:Zn-dependent protease
MILDAILLIVFAALPAIVLHEYAHGWSANQLGDSTAKNLGRLTLNPIKHIDPVGSLIVPGALFLAYYFHLTPSLLLFGWAKPVPVNFRNLKYKRLGMILVAAAGPFVNILLAALFIQLFKMPFFEQWNYVLGWGILLNLTLAVFNMMPIPPLDGSRILTGLLPQRLAYEYNRLEPWGLIIVVVLMQMGMLQFLYPVVSHLAFILGFQL